MWKLYWIEVAFETPENCFVVAKNARSARSIEYRQWGEGYNEISAEFVLNIPKYIEEKVVECYKVILQKHLKKPYENDDIENLKNKLSRINSVEDLWPDYANHRPVHGEHWLLNELGAKRYYRERRLVTEIDGVEYIEGSFEDHLGNLIKLKDLDKESIISVENFKEKIRTLKNDKINTENLIYRGQKDAYWKLECGIQRYVTDGIINEEERVKYEKQILKQ